MRAHEAGALHADLERRGPSWLRPPADVNALVPQLWPATVTRDPAGPLTVGGVPVTALAAEYGTPAYILDEADLRARCREMATAFAAAGPGRWTVYYAGKAFLCRAVARIIAEEGLNLDVCTGGELAVALAAGFPPERIGFHGNNKSTAELAAALDAGVGRIVLDSFHEIERLSQLARAGCGRRCWSGSPWGWRRTPTSTSPPPTRTRSSASRSPAGRRTGPRRSCSPTGSASWSGCTRTSARRSSTPPGSRSPPAACW